MRGISLRLRLLLGAAVWIGLALIAVGFLLAHSFRAHLEASAQADLAATLNRLVAQIDPSAVESLQRPLADPRYELPYGGLYWQVSDSEGRAVVRSPSLFDVTLEPGPDQTSDLKRLVGPAGDPLLGLSQTITFSSDAGGQLVVTVAREREDIELSVRAFSMQLASALALVWGALTLAAVLQVNLGLAPLAQLRKGIADVRSGGVDRLGGEYPIEVGPLVGQVNSLLEEQKASLEFARARAGDLAHALRTPLSALETTKARLRALGDHAEAEALDDLIETMNERIEYQLRLTQLRLRSANSTARARLHPAIEQVVSVLQRTEKGGKISWSIHSPTDVEVRLDRQDLIELIGVLLENALRHTRDGIDVVARVDGDWVELSVRDNGAGMSDQQMATARNRGVRHDESQPGTGLGLSIAHDIAEINGGRLELVHAQPNGLTVCVHLPSAVARTL